MEIKLIEFVKRNPLFYDKENTNYRNQLLKDEKWQQFSNATKIPVTVLKKRWKSLRDRYYRLLKTGDPNKTNYKYFQELQFLSGVNMFCNKRKIFEIKDEAAVDDLLTKSEDSFLLDEASFSSFYDNNKISPEPYSPPRKQRKLSDSQEHTEGKELREFIKMTPDHLQSTTPFRAFLESIALAVEQTNFDLNDIIRLQMSILQLVQTEVENHTINSA